MIPDVPSRLPHDELQKALPLLANFPYDPAAREYALNVPQPRLFVDNPDEPTAVLICRRHKGISFIAGEETAAVSLLQHYLTHHNEQSPLGPICLPTAHWRLRLSNHFGMAYTEEEVVSFQLDETRLPFIRQWPQRVPSGFVVRRLDAELAALVAQENRGFQMLWPELDHFVAQGLGYCLLRGTTIVTLACSVFPLGQHLEITVGTKEEFRGRGFAALTCAPLLEFCRERNITPHWGTRASHKSSQRAAAKAGFAFPRHHYWMSLASH